MDFHQLIAPHSVEVFFQEYFDNAPLIAHPDPKDSWLLFKTEEQLVDFVMQHTLGPGIQVSVENAKRKVLQEEYLRYLNLAHTKVQRGLNFDELVSLFDQQKATIRWSEIHSFVPQLHRLFDSLKAQFEAKVKTGLLLVPVNTSTPLDYAVYDRFFVHQIGSIQVEIHNPIVEKPLGGTREESNRKNHSDVFKNISLSPGEVIYLPRGFRCTIKGGDSFNAYLELRVYNTTWASVVSNYIDELATKYSVLREGVNAAQLRNEESEKIVELQQIIEAELKGGEIEAWYQTQRFSRSTETKFISDAEFIRRIQGA